MTPDAALACWIDELRARVGRGDLDDHPPVELGYGTRCFPAARVVRILLTDLADLEAQTGVWDGDAAWYDERRRTVLDDFRRLRAVID